MPPLPETPPHLRLRLLQGLQQAFVLGVIMFSSLGCYLIVLWWRGPYATIVTYTPADDWIPFRADWVWVYLIPYLIGPVTVGMLSRETFRWYIRRGMPLVGVSLLIFAILPTKTVRPDTGDIGTGWTAQIYRNMIAIDGPAANAAPSLHVSLTCLLAWALFKDYPRWWLVTLVGVGIVWLSTLVTRQHHLIDVFTGILIASIFALPWNNAESAQAR